MNEQIDSCQYCGKDYIWDSSIGDNPEVCNRRCGQAISLGHPVRHCKCGVVHSSSSHYHCGVERTSICIECREDFSYICKGTRRVICSTACISRRGTNSEQAKAARSDTAKIQENAAKHREALQKKYGEEVVNTSQIPQVREQRRDQLLTQSQPLRDAFKEKYGVESPWGVPELRSIMEERHSIAAVDTEVRLRQMRARYPHIQHMEEFLSLDHGEWARKFLSEKGRKPHPRDFMEHFNLMSLPVIEARDKCHFSLRDSALELHFMAALENLGLTMGDDFIRRARFLRHPVTGNPLELDFYLPELNIAFEIQDFGTHDRREEDVIGPWGNVKKGPDYHAMKIQVAKEAGIILHEIWEDELEDGEILLDRIGELLTPGNNPLDIEANNQRSTEYEVNPGAEKEK